MRTVCMATAPIGSKRPWSGRRREQRQSLVPWETPLVFQACAQHGTLQAATIPHHGSGHLALASSCAGFHILRCNTGPTLQSGKRAGTV